MTVYDSRRSDTGRRARLTRRATPMEEIPNPFSEPALTAREASPAAVAIFGASGDLTSRKLIPALFKLSRQRLLAPGTAIVGVARRPMTDEAFREAVRADLSGVSSGPGAS